MSNVVRRFIMAFVLNLWLPWPLTPSPIKLQLAFDEAFTGVSICHTDVAISQCEFLVQQRCCGMLPICTKVELISSLFDMHSGSIRSTRYHDCRDVFFISVMVCVMFSFKNAFVHAQSIFERHGEQVQHPCVFWISDNFRPSSRTFVHSKHLVARVSIPAFLGIFHWAIAVAFFVIEVDLIHDRTIVPVTAILNKLQTADVDVMHLCCVRTYTWVIGFSGRQEWKEEEET